MKILLSLITGCLATASATEFLQIRIVTKPGIHTGLIAKPDVVERAHRGVTKGYEASIDEKGYFCQAFSDTRAQHRIGAPFSAGKPTILSTTDDAVDLGSFLCSKTKAGLDLGSQPAQSAEELEEKPQDNKTYGNDDEPESKDPEDDNDDEEDGEEDDDDNRREGNEDGDEDDDEDGDNPSGKSATLQFRTGHQAYARDEVPLDKTFETGKSKLGDTVLEAMVVFVKGANLMDVECQLYKDQELKNKVGGRFGMYGGSFGTKPVKAAFSRADSLQLPTHFPLTDDNPGSGNSIESKSPIYQSRSFLCIMPTQPEFMTYPQAGEQFLGGPLPASSSDMVTPDGFGFAEPMFDGPLSYEPWMDGLLNEDLIAPAPANLSNNTSFESYHGTETGLEPPVDQQMFFATHSMTPSTIDPQSFVSPTEFSLNYSSDELDLASTLPSLSSSEPYRVPTSPGQSNTSPVASTSLSDDHCQAAFNQVAAVFKNLARARAAADPRRISRKQKQRDASIALYLERLRDTCNEAVAALASNDDSFSDIQNYPASLDATFHPYEFDQVASSFQSSSSNGSPISASLNSCNFSLTNSPTESPSFQKTGARSSAIPSSSSAYQQSSSSAYQQSSHATPAPAVTGGIELVMDLNMNTATSLPRRHRPRTQAQRERYLAVRNQGACEKHKKQHKRCTCIDRVLESVSKNTIASSEQVLGRAGLSHVELNPGDRLTNGMGVPRSSKHLIGTTGNSCYDSGRSELVGYRDNDILQPTLYMRRPHGPTRNVSQFQQPFDGQMEGAGVTYTHGPDDLRGHPPGDCPIEDRSSLLSKNEATVVFDTTAEPIAIETQMDSRHTNEDCRVHRNIVKHAARVALYADSQNNTSSCDIEKALNMMLSTPSWAQKLPSTAPLWTPENYDHDSTSIPSHQGMANVSSTSTLTNSTLTGFASFFLAIYLSFSSSEFWVPRKGQGLTQVFQHLTVLYFGLYYTIRWVSGFTSKSQPRDEFSVARNRNLSIDCFLKTNFLLH
ncbi:hypothetical protein FQN57_001553 [Myotisia sp. PD_48]|nr:hypothetical protein FQN57_001553 [Myotisia sp. PD_48]